MSRCFAGRPPLPAFFGPPLPERHPRASVYDRRTRLSSIPNVKQRHMTDAGSTHQVREMGYDADEFARTLPLAMRDWQVVGKPMCWQVIDQQEQPIASIEIRPLPARRLGALSLPVLQVRISLAAVDQDLAAEFHQRFDRGFHRGGG